MRALRNLFWFAVGFTAITAYAVSLDAHAQSSSGDSYTWYRNPDGSWARSPNPAGGTPGKNFRFPPGAQWQAESGGPRVVSNRKLPVPNVLVADVLEEVKIPKAALKTAGRLALRTMPYALIAAEVINALSDDGITYDAELETYVLPGPPDMIPLEETQYVTSTAGACKTSGARCAGSVPANGTRCYGNEQCLALLESWVGVGSYCQAATPVTWPGTWQPAQVYDNSPPTRMFQSNCQLSGSTGQTAQMYTYQANECPSGYTVQGAFCVKPTEPVPATDFQLEDALGNEDIMTDAEIAQWFSEQQRLYLPDDTPMTLTPSQTSISTPTVVSTSTTPNGTTRTETSSRVDLTGGGSTVNTSYVTTTITNITTVYNENNEVVRQDETPVPVPPPTPEPDIEPEPDPDEDFDFVDSSFPEVPELYQQKYPEGIKGVWNAKKPELMQTPFVAGIASMFPSFGGGVCPVWSMDFNILPGSNYGTQVFSVPCWIFQAIGLILLTSAVFAARWIMFGG